MGPSPLLFPSIRYILIYKDKIPVDFQFSRLNRLISVFHHMTDLQSLNHLHDTALDLLQYIHVSFVPKARHRSQMRLNRAEKRKRITFLDLLATLCLRQLRRILASFITGEYCWIKSVRISRTSAAKQLSSWYALACSGACYFSPVAGLGISLCWTLCKSPVSSFLQLAEVPLNGRTTLWQISYSFPFCIIWKTAESVLCPFIQVNDEEVKEYWPQ